MFINHKYNLQNYQQIFVAKLPDLRSGLQSKNKTRHYKKKRVHSCAMNIKATMNFSDCRQTMNKKHLSEKNGQVEIRVRQRF